MFTATQKIILGLMIVAALTMVAPSAFAYTYISVSAGSGAYPYYDAFYVQPYYYNYDAYTYYPYSTYNYGYSYGGSFWNTNNNFRISNPPKANPQAPITISGLGFIIPPKGTSGTPVAQQTPVCSFGTYWNGSACAAAGVTCPAGQVYSAGMNICIPNRAQ